MITSNGHRGIKFPGYLWDVYEHHFVLKLLHDLWNTMSQHC